MRPRANQALQIDTFLAKQGSPLAGYGKHFVAAGRKYKIDPLLLVAISGAETSFGKYGPAQKIFNAWGWGPHIQFGSWQEGIDTVARGLAKGYVSQGLTTIPQIAGKWAPVGASNDPTNLNSNWVKNVSNWYGQLGGARASRIAAKAGIAPPAVPRLPAPKPPAVDFTPVLLQGLQQLASGRYNPMQALGDLQAFEATIPAATAEAAGKTPVSTAGTDAKKPSKPVKVSGDWAGSLAFGQPLVGDLGLAVTSTKRDRKSTASGGVSDHWAGSKSSYAWDLGGSPAQMDAAAKKLMAKLGVRWDGGPIVFNTTRDGYRIQILYRTDVGGNHHDHIHVGIRRVG